MYNITMYNTNSLKCWEEDLVAERRHQWPSFIMAFCAH